LPTLSSAAGEAWAAGLASRPAHDGERQQA
jgi:hypothetical protein